MQYPVVSRRVAIGAFMITAAGTAACRSTVASPTAAPPGQAAQPTATGAVSSPAPRRERDRIRLDFTTKSMPYAHHLLAMERGYYADEGIDVELVQVPGTGAAAVLAGETQFSTASSTLLSAILKGAEMKIIFTNTDRPVYQLWSSQPEIRSLADLTGKAVGINIRGDTMEISTRILLSKAGLDPNGVVYTPLNTPAARLAAVQTGSVAAAILGIADVERLQQAGPKGNLLADLTKDIKMLFTGVGTSDKLIQQNPDLVERFVRGTIKGREFFRQYRTETVDIIAGLNGAARDVNEADYDSVLATMTTDGRLSEEDQLADSRVRAGIVGAETLRPISEIFDYRFVRQAYDELDRAGWRPQAG